MKGPGIKDYLEVIAQMKEDAIVKGLSVLEINSKELHQQVSPHHATMPTCCQAIYKMLLEGDEILSTPRGNTGYGSYLTVRYHLADLNRMRMFPDKKRGRPAKSEEEKLAAKRARLKRNSEELKQLIKNWLENNGWTHIEHQDYIEALNQEERWIINVEGIKRGRKQPLPSLIGDILKHMEDVSSSHFIVFNDCNSYRKQWSEFPQAVKQRLGLKMIVADKQGNLTVL